MTMDRGPGFFTRLKENLRYVKNGKPGSRFIDCYRYKQELRRKYGPIYRRIDITLGAAVTLFGLVMVPAPGPGWIIVALGFALIAGESQNVAKAMDGTERRLRRLAGKLRRQWNRSSIAVKSFLAVGASALATALAWGVYLVWQAVTA